MVKIFSELLINFSILTFLNDETILEIITEVKNVAVIVIVRVLWVIVEWLYKYFRKKKNGRETS